MESIGLICFDGILVIDELLERPAPCLAMKSSHAGLLFCLLVDDDMRFELLLPAEQEPVSGLKSGLVVCKLHDFEPL